MAPKLSNFIQLLQHLSYKTYHFRNVSAAETKEPDFLDSEILRTWKFPKFEFQNNLAPLLWHSKAMPHRNKGKK